MSKPSPDRLGLILAAYPESDPYHTCSYPHHIPGIDTAVAGYRCHLCSYYTPLAPNIQVHLFKKHLLAKAKTGGHYSACGDIQSFGLGINHTGPRWFLSSPVSLAVPAQSSSMPKRARPEPAAVEQPHPKRSRPLALSSQPEPGSVPAGDSSGANFATPVKA
jgi:hypothetical protein